MSQPCSTLHPSRLRGACCARRSGCCVVADLLPSICFSLILYLYAAGSRGFLVTRPAVRRRETDAAARAAAGSARIRPHLAPLLLLLPRAARCCAAAALPRAAAAGGARSRALASQLLRLLQSCLRAALHSNGAIQSGQRAMEATPPRSAKAVLQRGRATQSTKSTKSAPTTQHTTSSPGWSLAAGPAAGAACSIGSGGGRPSPMW